MPCGDTRDERSTAACQRHTEHEHKCYDNRTCNDWLTWARSEEVANRD